MHRTTQNAILRSAGRHHFGFRSRTAICKEPAGAATGKPQPDLFLLQRCRSPDSSRIFHPCAADLWLHVRGGADRPSFNHLQYAAFFHFHQCRSVTISDAAFTRLSHTLRQACDTTVCPNKPLARWFWWQSESSRVAPSAPIPFSSGTESTGSSISYCVLYKPVGG